MMGVLVILYLMLSVQERRLIQFKQALRAYHACKPFCLTTDPQKTLNCFEECSRVHKDTADKLRVTLQFNIE